MLLPMLYLASCNVKRRMCNCVFPAIRCPILQLTNAIVPTSYATTYHSQINVTCLPGYQINSTHVTTVLTCQANGNWSYDGHSPCKRTSKSQQCCQLCIFFSKKNQECLIIFICANLNSLNKNKYDRFKLYRLENKEIFYNACVWRMNEKRAAPRGKHVFQFRVSVRILEQQIFKFQRLWSYLRVCARAASTEVRAFPYCMYLLYPLWKCNKSQRSESASTSVSVLDLNPNIDFWVNLQNSANVSSVHYDNLHTAVDCGTPPVLTDAIPTFAGGALTTFGSSPLAYTCESGRWFSRDKRTVTASCAANKTWNVDGIVNVKLWPSCVCKYDVGS